MIAVCVSCDYETPDYPDLESLKNKVEQDRVKNHGGSKNKLPEASFIGECPECTCPNLRID